ncbi:hypothetical protein [Metabacillus kandeliae]|nr:hypothetical protein [Metabacillus kandeliae]
MASLRRKAENPKKQLTVKTMGFAVSKENKKLLEQLPPKKDLPNG